MVWFSSILMSFFRKEIMYDLLWVFFWLNIEVYVICCGIGVLRCVIYNYCEEMKRLVGLRYFYVSICFLNSDGRVFGEIIVCIEIDIFWGVKWIEFFLVYFFEYYFELDIIRR